MMTERVTKIGVLVSGGGSNLQAIIDAVMARTIQGRIALVISDRPEVYALERAAKAGIPTTVIAPADFPSREAFTRALVNSLQAAEVELVVMAGFMRVVTDTLITAFPGRILNTHPALIPSFCGMGFYGHRVHEAVLAAGVKVSGCTVHFVEEDVDAGPIIVQRTVPVLDDDTADTLAARVLVEEHVALPEAVRLFCAGRLRIDGRKVRVLPVGECVSSQ